jgi:hypothetical protein
MGGNRWGNRWVSSTMSSINNVLNNNVLNNTHYPRGPEIDGRKWMGVLKEKEEPMGVLKNSPELSSRTRCPQEDSSRRLSRDSLGDLPQEVSGGHGIVTGRRRAKEERRQKATMVLSEGVRLG